jgi:peroxiredoxin
MLNQKIRATIEQIRDSMPPDISALIEQGAGEISALDISERALRPGDVIPDFTLLNQKGQAKSAKDYLARGPLVVTFYRGAWCPYCNLQVKEYSDQLDRIEAAGGTLIALTPEKPDAFDTLSKACVAQDFLDMVPRDVPFDVLQDEGNTVAEAFGLVFDLPESHRRLLEQLNIDLEAVNGERSYTFPDPATYVIAPSGEITWAFVPNNYRKRAEVADIVEAIEQIAATS